MSKLVFFDWLSVTAIAVGAAVAAGHALMFKRDSRAALGWVAVSLMFPVIGPLSYFIFGINRIHTRAREMRGERGLWIRPGFERAPRLEKATEPAADLPDSFRELARISDAVSGLRLLGGHRIELLKNGEEAYPRMLAAIEAAEETLYLSTYIFESNRTGREFIDALARATSRGVDARVIVDGIGELYSWPRAVALLRRAGVRAERFLPPRLIPPSLRINLRNHRKILVADGRVAFTGGMNLGDRHLAADTSNKARVIDLHLALEGPAAAQIEEVFLEDWFFLTGTPPPPPPPPIPEEGGGALCRALPDGPNEDLDKLAMVLVGAVSSARRRVTILTPYFLPPRELIAALQAAALRGVEVTVVLPEKNNLPFVHWATRNMLWELLGRGVRIFYRPPPFVHSKLFAVDDHYVLIGSANLDPRSLRLNFELGVEIYDDEFGEIVAGHVERVLEDSRPVTLEEVDRRSLPVRLRDALVWLFSPYL